MALNEKMAALCFPFTNSTDLTDLLRACLKLLELPAQQRVYRPEPPLLWRVPDALVRIRQMLGELPDGAPLERFLPLSEAGHVSALQRRAALASTLLAGLELSRDGATVIEQHQAFGEIRLGPAGSCVTGTVPTRDSAAA